MNNKNKFLALIVLTIICGSFLNWKFCCNPSSNQSTPIVKKTKPIVIPDKKKGIGISIIDDQGPFRFTDSDHFSFPVSSANLITPVSKNIDIGLEKLRIYLEKYPQKNIAIRGFYKKDESYTGALPDLGFARATVVKNYLLSKKISSKQLAINSQLKESLVLSKNKSYDDAIAFDFSAVAKDLGKELTALKLKIQANPLILYFKTGESDIQLSASQKQKVVDISRYLYQLYFKISLIFYIFPLWE